MDARLPRVRAGHLPSRSSRLFEHLVRCPGAAQGHASHLPRGYLGQSLGDTAHDWSSRECGAKAAPGHGLGPNPTGRCVEAVPSLAAGIQEGTAPKGCDNRPEARGPAATDGHMCSVDRRHHAWLGKA